MKTNALLMMLMLGGAALAAPPNISIPKEAAANPGRILMLTPTGDGFDQSRWRLQYGVTEDGRVIRPSAVDLIPVDGGKAAAFAATIPGEYLVSVTVWNKDGISDAEVRIIVGGGPKPGPGPGPDPAPAPAPKGRKLYVAVVRDPANITPAVAAVIGDTKFMNAAVGEGGDWDAFDHTSDVADKKGYLNQARLVQAAGAAAWTPAVVVLDRDTGKVLNVAPLPATKEGLTALINKVR